MTHSAAYNILDNSRNDGTLELKPSSPDFPRGLWIVRQGNEVRAGILHPDTSALMVWMNDANIRHCYLQYARRGTSAEFWLGRVCIDLTAEEADKIAERFNIEIR